MSEENKNIINDIKGIENKTSDEVDALIMGNLTTKQAETSETSANDDNKTDDKTDNMTRLNIDRMPRKSRLIYDIERLAKAANKDIKKSKRDLSRMRINQLEQLLGTLTNSASLDVINDNVDNLNKELKREMSTDLMANILFDMHLLGASAIESTSIYFKDKLPPKISLTGYTKNNINKAAQIKECLKSIIPEYKDVLSNYVHPLSAYVLISTQILAETIVINANKPQTDEKKTTQTDHMTQKIEMTAENQEPIYYNPATYGQAARI